MNHVKFAPRVLAMGLLAASALSIPAFAAPADGSSTAIRVDRDPASAGTSTGDSPGGRPSPTPWHTAACRCATTGTCSLPRTVGT